MIGTELPQFVRDLLASPPKRGEGMNLWLTGRCGARRKSGMSNSPASWPLTNEATRKAAGENAVLGGAGRGARGACSGSCGCSALREKRLSNGKP